MTRSSILWAGFAALALAGACGQLPTSSGFGAHGAGDVAPNARKKIQNIQGLFTMAHTASGTQVAGTPQPMTTSYSVTTAVPSPSLDGNSTLLELAPSVSHPSDVLYWSPMLADPPRATHAIWSFQYRLTGRQSVNLDAV